jgi:hypothetical protein
MKMKKRTSVILFALISLCFSPAAAETVILDFSSGLGSNFTFLSNPSGKFTLDDSGGDLNIQSVDPLNMPGGRYWGGYVESKFELVGNFDIQVQYTVNMSAADFYGVQVQLNCYDVYIVRSHQNNITGNNTYHVWDGAVRNPVVTTDLSGAFRFVRIGSDLTGYYYGGSSWIPLYTETGFGANPVKFAVMAQPNTIVGYNQKHVDVTFDNFTITADELRGYQTQALRLPLIIKP